MSKLFDVGRWLLITALACLAVWYLATWNTRIAYLDLAGRSQLWTVFAALVMAGLSGVTAMRFFNSALLLTLLGALFVMIIVLYGEFEPGGIGEYPAELRGEVNFKATLVHIAMMGSVLLAWQGSLSLPSSLQRKSYLIGRVLIGAYFIVNALWQWYYLDIRAEHVTATGGNPALIPVAIGVQLICGTLVATNYWARIAIWPLALVIIASTAMVHGDLSATAPYPPNIQIQQWFIKSAILAGLLMTLAAKPLGESAAIAPAAQTRE